MLAAWAPMEPTWAADWLGPVAWDVWMGKEEGGTAEDASGEKATGGLTRVLKGTLAGLQVETASPDGLRVNATGRDRSRNRNTRDADTGARSPRRQATAGTGGAKACARGQPTTGLARRASQVGRVTGRGGCAGNGDPRGGLGDAEAVAWGEGGSGGRGRG